MARTKRGVISKARHKKVLKSVKGQYGRRKNTIRIARQAMEKAMQYAYRDRKAKKRDFRSLWIQRINAGTRIEGLSYSKFINRTQKLKKEYNACLEQIKLFRSQHLEYAATYIHKQSQIKNPFGRGGSTITGTGGTPFMKYLKKHRDETQKQKIKNP